MANFSQHASSELNKQAPAHSYLLVKLGSGEYNLGTIHGPKFSPITVNNTIKTEFTIRKWNSS